MIKPADDRPLCRHCVARVANKNRGLCYRCYYTPAVRALYTLSTHKSGRRGPAQTNPAALPLPEPTLALPGTPEKIAVLRDRVQARQALFHPADARDWSNYRPPGELSVAVGRWGGEVEEVVED